MAVAPEPSDPVAVTALSGRCEATFETPPGRSTTVIDLLAGVAAQIVAASNRYKDRMSESRFLRLSEVSDELNTSGSDRGDGWLGGTGR